MLVPVIAGPTGVGKTALAAAVAGQAAVEIVSADSRQVYRGLEIGTAAPSRGERAGVSYHGVGFVDPRERYSAGRFAREAAGWIALVAERGATPLVVGGTGLYLRALFDGLFLEPDLDDARRRRLGAWLGGLPRGELARWAGRLDRAFRGGGAQRGQRAVEVALLTGRPISALQEERPPEPRGIRPWYAVLTLERGLLRERIAVRARAMLEAGWIEEVRSALAAGVPADAPGLSAVGYREIVAHIAGRIGAARLEEAIIAATRRYAKRQETWFRHQLRGPVVRLDAAAEPEALARALLAAYRAAAD